MKHSIKTKILCSLLSVLLVMQIVPLSTLAVEKPNIISSEIASADVSLKESPDILYEVVEKRSEFTKVYKLSDGSYYEVISNEPVHIFNNGYWCNPNGIESENSLTIDEITDSMSIATKHIEKSSSSTFARSTNISENETNDFSVYALEAGEESYHVSSSYDVAPGKIFIAVPRNINGYIGKTRGIISANIKMNCNDNRTVDNSNNNNDGETVVAVEMYQNLASCTEYNLNNYYPDYISDRLLDYNIIDGSGDYYWDITDLYYRWERGIEPNYGVIFKVKDIEDEEEETTPETADITVLSQFLIVNYIEIDILDEEFNYYSIDVGRAGNLYINEFMGSPTMLLELMGTEGEILPVSLKMMYTENYYNSPLQYGYNWGINYMSSLTYENAVFKWELFDGSSVAFLRTNPVQTNNGLSKWTEPTGKYVLWVNENKTFNNKNFSDNYIESDDDMIYTFQSGQNTYKANVTGITDKHENSIHINYTNGNLISYIQDGYGRKFNFSYDYHTGTSIKSLKKIELVDLNENPVFVDGDKICVEFTYTNFVQSGSSINRLLLSSVKFPDEKIVYYEYDGTGKLKTIRDGEEKEVSIEYLTITENEEAITSKFIEKCTVKQDAQNIEFVCFECTSPYERIIIRKDSDENIVSSTHFFYNSNLKVICEQDSKGNSSYYSYNVNEDLSAYKIPVTEATNLIKNPSFTSKSMSGTNKTAANWDEDFVDVYRGTRPGSSKDYCMIFNGDITKNYYATQTIDLSNVEDLSTGDIYAIGGKGLASFTIPKSQRFFGIKVHANYTNNVNQEICSVAFDNTLCDEWQTRFSAFKIDKNYLNEELVSLTVECKYSEQNGTAYFDDLQLYLVSKHEESDIVSGTCPCEDLCKYELGDCPCECSVDLGEVCSCVSCNANTTYHLSDINGNITDLTKTDGSKNMITTYNYNASGNYITSVVDENGLTTYYTNDDGTGLLTSVGDENGITNYTYNSMNALETVSRAITNLSGESINYITSYNYTDDKIIGINHNGFTYSFEYDSFGNCTKVYVGQTVEDANKTLLVDYDYSGDLDSQYVNKITYANGDTITYSYVNNLVNWISFDDGETKAFEYEYDTEGNITTIVDYASDLTTKYNYSVTNEDNTTTVYEVYTYKTSTPDVIKYCRETVDGVTNDSFTDVSFSESDITNNYNGQTGITINSNTLDYYNGKFITASATDYFGRRINVPANTSITSDNNSETMSSSSVVIEKDLNGNNLAQSETYYYYNDTEDTARSQVAGYKNIVSKFVDGENTANGSGWYSCNEYSYEYDASGNLTHIYNTTGTSSTLDYRYYYNEANQIIREDNRRVNETYVYEYDAGGNILCKKIYEYTTGGLQEETVVEKETINFSYDSTWKDKLTSFGNYIIEYDDLGNPTSYNGKELDWNGRQLVSFKNDTQKYYYTYDSEGYCTSKSIYSLITDSNGNETEQFSSKIEFVWKDGKLIYQYNNDTNFTVKYLYDQNEEPYGFITKGEGIFEAINVFYYVKNKQGDIERIVRASTGDTFVWYKYDAWGNVELSVSSYNIELALAGIIVAANNMLTYRGYFYDVSANLYLLKSRYYNPEWGRFLSLDLTETAKTAQTDILSANLYLYCLNNPVSFTDPSGYASQQNYFFVYDNPGSDFIEQADWMKKYNYKNKNCTTYKMRKISSFENYWNSLPNKGIKDIHLYFHGGKGFLAFKNEEMYVDEIKKLKKTSLSGKVYLYSCNGGTPNSYGETVAGAFAQVVSGAKVRAVVNGKVYYRAWYQLFSRKPLTKEKGAYWADFHYGKYKGKMTVYCNRVGNTWRL